MRICVVGLGYVGMSMAVLLARHHEVTALDIDEERVGAVNDGKPTVIDDLMTETMAQADLSLSATTDQATAYRGADYIIVATPTDYDPDRSFFDTSTVEQTISEALVHAPHATIAVKSTIPVGFVAEMRKKHGTEQILFSPEFLREGRALHDNLRPSRIIVGSRCDRSRRFAQLLADAAEIDDVPILLTGPTEAEAVKLFANTYLAMRIAFFNELDSFGMARQLDVAQIVDGVCLDPRIGSGYNNPSFGYGGYCLPKDTKQLLANYQDVPQHMIQGIVAANSARKDVIAEAILARGVKTVGIYRMAMKQGSDNIRSSAVQGVMKRLNAKGVDLLIYEPLLDTDSYFGSRVLHDATAFFDQADLIVSNRLEPELEPYRDRVFTRDLFGEN